MYVLVSMTATEPGSIALTASAFVPAALIASAPAWKSPPEKSRVIGMK
jgi:hypothetical protein